MNYYDILEVRQGADFTEIRSSYRRLVKLYHPDLNPSALARDKIVKLTEAYEVLSDPGKKQLYDRRLSGAWQPAVAAPPQADERETWKREYIRKKREKEQKQWEQIFQMKVLFYKVQRYFAVAFVLIAAVYSFDYFYTEPRGAYEIEKVRLNKWEESVVRMGTMNLKTGGRLYYGLKWEDHAEAELHYSLLHGVPVGIKVTGLGYYHLTETVHSFRNFFSYLLGFLGFLLLVNHRYSDWLLTLGLVPFFIMAFLFLLTYTTRLGIY